MKEKESEVTQLCPTLCDPVDCSLPGSSIHRIFQARIRSGFPFPSPGESSQPRDRTRVSCIGGRRFNLWATGEALSICISFLWLLNILPQTWRLNKRNVCSLSSGGQKSSHYARFWVAKGEAVTYFFQLLVAPITPVFTSVVIQPFFFSVYVKCPFGFPLIRIYGIAFGAHSDNSG